MDAGVFSHDILNSLEEHVPAFDAQWVWTAYQDAANIIDIVTRFESEVPPQLSVIMRRAPREGLWGAGPGA